jgi:hypothetical protein
VGHRSRSAGLALSYKLIAPSSTSHTFQLGNDIEIIETLKNTVTKKKEKYVNDTGTGAPQPTLAQGGSVL